ncbi:hypothetical protein [Methanococcus voltae]|uniref:Uncharacterized protein n=1 Tax=Methanococcus voltae (strain ATCC BAA-1334 / A3) TaxID=456320 RepID=D7DSJ7_METV3|nr:hypothetical protein [Methanococcus voltae]MCS3901706.1 hypothetical protein [Methanococcus voltae]
MKAKRLLNPEPVQEMYKMVQFNSEHKNWSNEVSGLKNNTIREFKENENDIRFKVLDDFMMGEYDKQGLFIRIVDKETVQYFERKITDVSTLYTSNADKLYIISWEPKKED